MVKFKFFDHFYFPGLLLLPCNNNHNLNNKTTKVLVGLKQSFFFWKPSPPTQTHDKVRFFFVNFSIHVDSLKQLGILFHWYLSAFEYIRTCNRMTCGLWDNELWRYCDDLVVPSLCGLLHWIVWMRQRLWITEKASVWTFSINWFNLVSFH